MTPHPIRHGAFVIIGAAALCACALRLAACADDGASPEVDVEQWTMRDLLGLGGDRQVTLTAAERAVVADRSVELGVEDLATTSLPDPDLTRAEPARVVVALDQAREAAGLDARVFGLYSAQAGAEATPCAPAPGDLLDTNGHPRVADPVIPEAWPAAWRAPTSWPAASALGSDPLRALAPQLARWAERCALARGARPATAEAPHAFRVTPHAPYLLAYWPERHQLHVNPLMLTIWTAEAAAGSAASAVTRRYDLSATTMTSLSACAADLEAQCVSCAADPSQCGDPLFTGADPEAECDTLADNDRYITYCAYAADQADAGFASCLAVSSPACALDDSLMTDAASVDDVVAAYAAFTNSACEAAADSCIGPEEDVPDNTDNTSGGGGSSCDGPDIDPCGGCGNASPGCAVAATATPRPEWPLLAFAAAFGGLLARRR